MDSIRRGDAALAAALQAHRARSGHWYVLVGGNFIECPICLKHAHLAPGGATLLLHDRATHFGSIEPGAF